MDDRRNDQFDQALHSLKSMKINLSPEFRRRLSRRCAEAAASSARHSFLGKIRGILTLEVPARPFAAALGLAVVLFSLTTVLVSVRQRPQAGRIEGVPQIRLVSLRPDTSGGVTLEWRDGDRRTYRVLKSDNPRDFSQAENFSVRGNRWTDPDKGAGGIAFYKVE